MIQKKFFLVAIILLLIFSAPAFADQLADADSALAHKDYITAFLLFQSLAQQGNPEAQRLLARMYYLGQGVEQNEAESLKWLKLSVDQGDDMAMATLGSMYDLGKGGVQKDMTQAVKWFRAAADHGNISVLPQLSYIYFNGVVGVPQNYAEAAKWDHKIIERDDFYLDVRDAQEQLGEIYAKGEGVAQDYVQAYMWLNLASASGDKFASQSRDAVAAKMTPEQIAEAQKLAREREVK